MTVGPNTVGTGSGNPNNPEEPTDTIGTSGQLDDFPWSLEVTMSGGGHRATAYALGALLYLVHTGLNKRVRNNGAIFDL